MFWGHALGLGGRTALLVMLAVAATLGTAGPMAHAGTYDYGTGAAVAWAQGYTGEGQTIAVMDTGFDMSHEWFEGNLAGEACIPDRATIPTTPCPDGSLFETGPGAARPPTPASLWSQDWQHRSRVSGTAVGAQSRELGFPQFFRGFAPEADVLAINFFSLSPAADPTLRFSDALRYVQDRRAELDITVLNLSVTDPTKHYRGPCDNQLPPYYAEVKRELYKLIDDGVIVTVSGGNYDLPDRYRNNRLRFPACLSRVITVGALDVDRTRRAPFSPTAPEVDVMAPGTRIRTPITYTPGGDPGIESASIGTSFAAPIVAGAAALYKQKYPNATPAEVQRKLMSTGPEVRLARGVKRRALKVDALLGLQAATPTRAIHPDCITLHFRPRSVREPNRMIGFARFRCLPSTVIDRLAVFVVGDEFPEWTDDWVTFLNKPQEYFGENLVVYGQREPIDTEPGQAYRVCYALYVDNDRLNGKVICKPFET